MKNPKGASLAGVILLGWCSAALAQESMEEKRDKKLKSAFLAKAVWMTDFEKARAEAKKNGKPIFAYFTRSYSP